MQTFLPFPSFEQTANVLDNRRLFKQSMECKQILSAILGASNGWRNHCITRLWENNPDHLLNYWKAINWELVNRNMKFIPTPEWKIPETRKPDFLGKEFFHSAYRAHLLAKNQEWYGSFSWKESPKFGYYSITKEGDWKFYGKN